MSQLWTDIKRWVAWAQFSSNDRLDIYNSLLILLNNQVQIHVAIQKLIGIYSEEGKHMEYPHVMALSDALLAIKNGMPLSRGLAGWTPNDELEILDAGEKSGDLQLAFDSIANLVAAKKRITSAILGAITYPLFLFGMTGFLLYMVSTSLVPKLAEVIPPSGWTGSALILKIMADVVSNYGMLTLFILTALVGATMISLPYLKGPIRIVLDHAPPWSLYRTLQGSTFLLNVSCLLQSGVKIDLILQKMIENASPWLKERLNATRHQLAQGKNFGQALRDTGYQFPDAKANQFLAVIAEYAGLNEAMKTFGTQWLEESIKSIETASNLLFILGISSVGVIMLLVIAGASGIESAMSQANTAL